MNRVTFLSLGDGKYSILLDSEQIGTLHRTQNGFFAHMHGDWTGLRATGHSLPSAQAAVTTSISAHIAAARVIAPALEAKLMNVTTAKSRFMSFGGVDLKKFTAPQFLKFLKKISE